ncbi:MAG: DUF1800 domain-containing protein [Chloroflexota bacterium]|nr:DUF1800 domain-containing protein [Chloroflexota bacterium]
MPTTRRDFLRFSAAAGGALAASTLIADVGTHIADAQSSTRPSASFDAALHALNRISYGARPDDVVRIGAIGIPAYIDEQLAPDSIDDTAMDERLLAHPILRMSRENAHALGFDGRTQTALMHGFLVRANHSQRQLFERVVEFWTDHFNIPIDDLAPDLIVMHREVIRRHAFGRFRDLAFGVARSPAMLTFLDNTYSTAEHPNENYARELLELHTLGVDGGHYSETDVKEAARALTGWQVHDGTDDGFFFNRDDHDGEAKTILGVTMPAGRGIEDGLHLLDLAVHHPATARFICRKLCVRFVSDRPSDALVESAAQVWEANDGAIVPVLRHILTSDEFASSAGLKMRRPLEFFVAALRATGAHFRNEWTLGETLTALGQAPYSWAPPNGYPDVAGAWLGSGMLLERWNTAILITHQAYSEQWTEVETDIRARIGDPATVGALVDAVANQVFAARLPDDARATFIAFVRDDSDESAPVTSRVIADKLGMLYGLMLASPHFQWT